MDNPMFKTIPLETAQEHFMDAARRGVASGKFLERQRIMALLKDKGMYDALLAIKNSEKP